jgi:hypothetical protein
MSAPRAPPATTEVLGPTPHRSSACRISDVTRGTWSGGNLGLGRSGASTMWPLTTTIGGSAAMELA